MRNQGEAVLKPGQGALIVTYGNTKRKLHPLDRDLLVLGRVPACDVALVSPEVAAVHCILQHTSDGWRIRDCCGGRHATRLNGRPIHEESLHDTDVLQIGTFSFEVRLPSAYTTPSPGSTPVVDERLTTRLKRLQRSRRNLVRLALRLRSRVRKQTPLPPALAELEQHAECLRGLQRDYEALVKEYEARLAEVEIAEREICDERAAFEGECVERQSQLDKAEHDLTRQQAEMEVRLKLRWEECEQLCRQAEQAHAPFLHALTGQDAANSACQELAAQLDRRRQELDHFARHLRRCRQQLLETTPSFARVKPAERASRNAEGEHWRERCEQLQAGWAVLEAQFQQRDAEAKAERDKARKEADGLHSTVKELQAITESLRRELHDRDDVLQTLRRQLEQQPAPVNLEHSGSYERELNAFHLELERDRRELNEQLCQLQARQAELEAAAREAELQMSRERAVIARERAELTRLRDDIRIARDRTAREGSVRDRLAQLSSLKPDLAGSSPSAPGDQLRVDSALVTADQAQSLGG